jgi:hypothetical protein
MSVRKSLAALILLVPGAAWADPPAMEPDYSAIDHASGAGSHIQADADAVAEKLVSDSLAPRFAELQNSFDREIAAKMDAEVAVKVAAMLPPHANTAMIASRSVYARRPVLYALAK